MEKTNITKLQGVRGWLLFLCISLIIIAPILSIFKLVIAYSSSKDLFERYPGFMIITVIDSILNIAIIAYSIYSGIALWTIRDNAVQTTKKYFIIGSLYVVISAILPFLAGFPAAVNEAMIAGACKAIPQGIIGYAIWYIYLNKSKRVKATYELKKTDA